MTTKSTSEATAIIAPPDPESPQAKAQRELNEFIARRTAEAQGRLISILERGVVGDRCAVALPDNLYGEWVSDDPSEIARMESLGFVQDNVYATQYALHSDGTGRAKVGDVIHMITSRDQKNLIEKLKEQVKIQRHGKAGERKQREEQDFINRTAKETPQVPALAESTANSADAKAVLTAVTQ